MSARASLLRTARQWVQKAENDLTNARHTLTIRRGCPLDTVCFHAQQCVEKYLKALLTACGIDFPRIHDLGELKRLLPQRYRLPLDVPEAERLTDYASVTRYPGDFEPIRRGEAAKAVAIAERVRKAVRAHLPEEALG